MSLIKSLWPQQISSAGLLGIAWDQYEVRPEHGDAEGTVRGW